MSEFFDATGRPDVARQTRAVASALFHGDAPSPFAEQLFVKVLSLEQPPTP